MTRPSLNLRAVLLACLGLAACTPTATLSELTGREAHFSGQTVTLSYGFKQGSTRSGCVALSGAVTVTLDGGKATLVDHGGKESTSTNICGTSGATCVPQSSTNCGPALIRLDSLPASGRALLEVKDSTGAWRFDVEALAGAEDAVLTGSTRLAEGDQVEVTCGPAGAQFASAWFEAPGTQTHHHIASAGVVTSSGNRATIVVGAVERPLGSATERSALLWCTSTRPVRECAPGFTCAVEPGDGTTPAVTLLLP